MCIQSCSRDVDFLAVSRLVTSLALYLGCLQAARWLHNNTVDNVLHSPLGFFDTTPIGRVLNRFSKDVDTLDNVLAEKFNSLFMCFFGVCFFINVTNIYSAFNKLWFLHKKWCCSKIYCGLSSTIRSSMLWCVNFLNCIHIFIFKHYF